MFSYFRREPSAPSQLSILELDDHAFVRAVLASQQNQPPAAGAMCVVAFLNLTPLIGVYFDLARRTGDSTDPSTLDAVIRFIASTLQTKTDEIGKRRLMWFFQAALIRRASQISEINPEHLSDTAQIWAYLVRDGAVLKATLQDNILWKDEEKEYFAPVRIESTGKVFSPVHDAKSGMEYVLNHVVPKHLRRQSALARLAEEHDLSGYLSV